MKLVNKNILIILEYGALGGAQRQALGLANYLSVENNCNIDLLLIRSNFETKEFSEFKKKCKIRNTFFLGEPYLFLPYEFTIKNLKRIKWNIQYLLKLRKGLLPYHYEIIIPYLNYSSKIAYILYKLLPTVKSTFWHQLGLDNLKNDIIEKYVANNIPFVIGNATNCFSIFENEYPLPKEKLNLLPQYLTFEVEKRNKLKILNGLNIPSSVIIIGMIAHYRKDKYFDLVIDAFAKIRLKTSKTIYLVLLGNKDNDQASLNNYEALKSKVENLNLTTSCQVISGMDVVEVLNILDIAILMSQIEGMPNSVMEYMSYGIPVIASNHPGCIHLLDNSKYLIANEVEELELKLLELIESEEARIIEGKLNFKRIQKFNLPDYVKNMESIFNKYI